MGSQPRNRNLLTSLILLGLFYSLLLHFQVRLTGVQQIDGIAGVLLGLFTCAQPAANVLNILLFGRYASPQKVSQRDRAIWCGLNAAVLLVGLIVIVSSLLRYSAIQ
jgi:hypothetical protein